MKKLDPNANVEPPSRGYTNERLALNGVETKPDEIEADVDVILKESGAKNGGSKSGTGADPEEQQKKAKVKQEVRKSAG